MSADRMRVLVDVNHPAQVHLFRNAVQELEGRGHETLVTAREKEVTVDLLEAYDLDYEVLSAEGSGTLSLLAEWLGREWKLLRVARRFDPDVVVSRINPPAVHASRLVGCRNVMFKDTVLPGRLTRTLYHGSTLPFVDDLCAPPSFDLPFVGENVHTVGFQELAYLHPNRFEPDRSRLREHGVDPDEPYFVVRFAAWNAYHDYGRKGWSREGKRHLVKTLSEHGRVYITSEEDLPPAFADYGLTIPPHLIHDLLYFSDLFVGDSQTMTTEAALLGTPVVRVNSKVGTHDMSNFVELERRGLLYSYRDEAPAIRKVRDIVGASEDVTDWQRKRRELIADKRDVTAFMLELILRERLTPERDRLAASAPSDHS